MREKMKARPSRRSSHGVGNVAALAKVVRTAAPNAASFSNGAGPGESDAADKSVTGARRRMLADFCRLIAERDGSKPFATVAQAAPAPQIDSKLPPRLRQTLQLLLRGDAEKQIAIKLGLSKHTVHVYVKSLHRWYGVSSRSELLARFIPQLPDSLERANATR